MNVMEHANGRLGIQCDRCFTVRTVTREHAERMAVNPDAAAAYLARHATHCIPQGGKR
jgi:hypothetical protein